MATFPLRRFQDTQLLIQQAKQLRSELEVQDAVMPTQQTKMRTPGDPWKLRGIPVVGVYGGVGGAIPGSRPGSNLR